MKKTLLYLMLFTGLFLAQKNNAQTITNGGFENWTGGNPVGWTTFNVPPVLVVVSQSSDKYSGTSSAKLNPVSFGTSIIPAILTSNSVATNLTPSYLNGYIKATLGANDSFIFSCAFISNTTGSGGGATELTQTSRAAWTPFHITLNYSTSFTPDSVFLYIILYGTTSAVVYLDDLTFSNTAIGSELGTLPTGTNEVKTQNIKSEISPNPVFRNSEINFKLSKQTNLTINIFDVTGRFVKTVLNEILTSGGHQIPFNADELQSGIYFYTISSEGINETKKFVVNK